MFIDKKPRNIVSSKTSQRCSIRIESELFASWSIYTQNHWQCNESTVYHMMNDKSLHYIYFSKYKIKNKCNEQKNRTPRIQTEQNLFECEAVPGQEGYTSQQPELLLCVWEQTLRVSEDVVWCMMSLVRHPSLADNRWSRAMHRVRPMRAETGRMTKGTNQSSESESRSRVKTGYQRYKDNLGENPRSGYRKQVIDPKTHYDRFDRV